MIWVFVINLKHLGLYLMCLDVLKGKSPSGRNNKRSLSNQFFHQEFLSALISNLSWIYYLFIIHNRNKLLTINNLFLLLLFYCYGCFVLCLKCCISSLHTNIESISYHHSLLFHSEDIHLLHQRSHEAYFSLYLSA